MYRYKGILFLLPVPTKLCVAANLLLASRIKSQNPSKFLTILMFYFQKENLYILCSPIIISCFEFPLHDFFLIPCLSHL